MSRIRFNLTLVVLVVMTAVFVFIAFRPQPSPVDVPSSADCTTYGAGNLLDHWTSGVVIDTCSPDSKGYQSVVALLAYNASHH